ncbi:MAG: DUF4179 domain-containing protein [Peptostreptococcaceae bacterium]
MKNKYELFNEIDMEENDYEIYKLSQTEKDELFVNISKDIKAKKNVRNKKYTKIAIASVLCVSILTITLKNEKVWALVESIGKQIESYLGKKEDEYIGYKESVNLVSEDKGIKVSLYEVLLDDGNILLSMNLDHSKFDESYLKKGLYLNKNYYLPEATVYMDGKKFVETGGATRYEREKNNQQNFMTSLRLERIDEDNDGMSDITDYQILDNIDPNKDYNIKVVFDEVGIHKIGLIPRVIDDEFEFIDGKWEFDFTVNGKNIIGETKVYNINEEINIEDEDIKAKINIKQLRISPISIKLTYTIKFEQGYMIDEKDLYIELLDQNGEYINVGGGSAGNEDGTLVEGELEGNLENNQKPESITILPYIYYREKNSNNPKYHHRIEFKDKAVNIDLNIEK